MASAAGKKNAAEGKALPAPKKATVARPAVKRAAAKVPAKAAEKAPAKATARAARAVDAPKEKVRKPKLVRDSFTMPEAEYDVLGQVKKACLAAGIEVKKSQLLRIGLVLLGKTEIGTLKKMIAALAPLKAGRPKKEK